MFKVLALDGGGIRGVATAAYLAELERQTGKSLHKYFDLITGTSTGGIIAAALAFEKPAADVLALYQNHGQKIFSKRPLPLPRKGASIIASLVMPMYSNKVLHTELKELFGAETRMGEAKCRLCIPVYNISVGKNVVLTTRHLPQYLYDHQLYVWHVVAATTAAPVYFHPFQLGNRGLFVDGGIWENSPIMVGVAEGKRLGYSLDEIQVLSIGTGTSTFQKDRGRLTYSLRFGLSGWNQKLMEMIFRAQTERANNYADLFLPQGHHHRIDFALPDKGYGLDDVNKIETLIIRASTEAKNTAHEVSKRFLQHETTPFTPITDDR